MAFTVNMYTFSKKSNSTKQPPATPTQTFNCTIKEPMSIINPSIKLNIGLATNPTALNYAHIPTFNRYYFIKDWVFENGLWIATLNVDQLATYKTEIGASTCYVLRSATTSNGSVMDTAYPVTGEVTFSEVTQRSPWNYNTLGGGCFIVGLAGKKVSYHIFSPSELEQFLDNIFSDDYAEALTTDWSDIFPQLKAQTNPLQYVTSLIWFPFQISGLEDATIDVGWVRIAQLNKRIPDNALFSDVETFTIERHPQSTRGSYLNSAPYSSYNLFFPPWGLIQLDPDIVANSTSIDVDWEVDLRTGQGTLMIYAGSHLMSTIQSQVGVPFQVSQIVSKGFGLGNLFNPLAQAGLGMMTGNYLGTGYAVASEIGNFASSKIPTVTTIGSTGGVNSLVGTPALQHEFKHIVSEDNTTKGRPLCSPRRINTLTGYILISEASLSISATKEELEMIESSMKGGFYYE